MFKTAITTLAVGALGYVLKKMYYARMLLIERKKQGLVSYMVTSTEILWLSSDRSP